MKKTVLREYARLIVRSGVNVQKGQEVLIYADLDQPEFVQMVVEAIRGIKGLISTSLSPSTGCPMCFPKHSWRKPMPFPRK